MILDIDFYYMVSQYHNKNFNDSNAIFLSGGDFFTLHSLSTISKYAIIFMLFSLVLAFNYSTADSLLKKTPRLFYAHTSLSNEVYKVKKQCKTHKHNITYLAQSTQKLCTKVNILEINKVFVGLFNFYFSS